MNDIPRQKLREIITRFGLTLIEDPRRVRALLLDMCSQYRPEIFVLVQAQEEAVAEDLLQIPDSVPLAMLVSQLTQRLVENKALSPEAARWSVESWAYALGKPIHFSTGPSSTQATTYPAAASNPAEQQVRVNDYTGVASMPPENAAMVQYIPINSEWPVEFYWRESSQPEKAWDYIGQTPGKVLLPAKGLYKLAPHIAGDALSIWASEITYPDNVAGLALDQPVSDAGFSALQYFSNITDLTVDNGEGISNKGFAPIQNLQKMKWLKLTWCMQVKEQGFAYFASLKELSDLKLEWAHITDKDCQSFSGLLSLEHLGLRECKHIHGDGLQHVQKNGNITSLDLAGASSLEDSAMRYIGEMKQLNKLNLSRCTQLTGRGISGIRNLQNLAYLDLGGVPELSDSFIADISGLEKLTSLSLAHTGITNTGLASLKSMQSLAYLDLSGCDAISDRGLKHLRELPNLTHLNLNVCKRLSSRGIDRLERPGLTIFR